MNSYISTSKKALSSWLKYFFILPTIYITTIFSFNFIIDPYGLTEYNILNIKYKLTRNDRIDKIEGSKRFDHFDTILLGSSRAYSINAKSVQKYLKGTSNYNFAIGGSQPEDHLGVLLYLQKENKLPKNIILGVDFNSFNPNVPINKYFLKSKELNFLNRGIESDNNFVNKLLTIDATRASVTTLKNHLKKIKLKPRFNKDGVLVTGSATYDNFNDLKNDKENVFSSFYKNGNYPYMDLKRVDYIERFIKICREENINLIMYASPTFIENYSDILNHHMLNKQLILFKQYFSQYNNFIDIFEENDFTKDQYNFLDRVHISTEAGDKLLALIFVKESKKNLSPQQQPQTSLP